MTKTLFALCAAALLFASCQKEPALTDPGNGNPPGGGTNPTTPKNLLTRMVQVDGSDSISYDYSYDGGGRLVKLVVKDNNAQTDEFRFYRNASGIMTRLVYVDLSQGAADSVDVKVGYDAANSRYAYLIVPPAVSGNPGLDSVAFSYTGANLTSVGSYEKITSPLPVTIPLSRTDYTYTGTNVTAAKDFSYDLSTSSWKQDYSTTYSYDSKTAAQKLSFEAILLEMPEWMGDNNAITQTEASLSQPPGTTTWTTTFTYTGFNKPGTGTIVETPGNNKSTSRYYYN